MAQRPPLSRPAAPTKTDASQWFHNVGPNGKPTENSTLTAKAYATILGYNYWDSGNPRKSYEKFTVNNPNPPVSFAQWRTLIRKVKSHAQKNDPHWNDRAHFNFAMWNMYPDYYQKSGITFARIGTKKTQLGASQKTQQYSMELRRQPYRNVWPYKHAANKVTDFLRTAQHQNNAKLLWHTSKRLGLLQDPNYLQIVKDVASLGKRVFKNSRQLGKNKRALTEIVREQNEVSSEPQKFEASDQAFMRALKDTDKNMFPHYLYDIMQLGVRPHAIQAEPGHIEAIDGNLAFSLANINNLRVKEPDPQEYRYRGVKYCIHLENLVMSKPVYYNFLFVVDKIDMAALKAKRLTHGINEQAEGIERHGSKSHTDNAHDPAKDARYKMTAPFDPGEIDTDPNYQFYEAKEPGDPAIDFRHDEIYDWTSRRSRKLNTARYKVLKRISGTLHPNGKFDPWIIREVHNDQVTTQVNDFIQKPNGDVSAGYLKTPTLDVDTTVTGTLTKNVSQPGAGDIQDVSLTVPGVQHPDYYKPVPYTYTWDGVNKKSQKTLKGFFKYRTTMKYFNGTTHPYNSKIRLLFWCATKDLTEMPKVSSSTSRDWVVHDDWQQKGPTNNVKEDYLVNYRKLSSINTSDDNHYYSLKTLSKVSGIDPYLSTENANKIDKGEHTISTTTNSGSGSGNTKYNVLDPVIKMQMELTEFNIHEKTPNL